KRSGARCAEITRGSLAMPNSSNTSAAYCIVSQSDREPMIIPTSGCDIEDNRGGARVSKQASLEVVWREAAHPRRKAAFFAASMDSFEDDGAAAAGHFAPLVRRAQEILLERRLLLGGRHRHHQRTIEVIPLCPRLEHRTELGRRLAECIGVSSDPLVSVEFAAVVHEDLQARRVVDQV